MLASFFMSNSPLRIMQLYFVKAQTKAILSMKEKMIYNSEPNPIRPRNFHDRTQHILPQDESTVRLLLDDINSYAEDHKMQINHESTKVIL
jgi:hypothetical protein